MMNLNFISCSLKKNFNILQKMKGPNKRYFNTSKTKIKLNFLMNTLKIFVSMFKILSEHV